jgi:glycosyltransferase involved in cell wall biosynthesis
MNPTADRIALLYDDDGYVETPGRPLGPGVASRTGLIGRQVAGKEFLDAYLSDGTFETLVALVRNQPSADTLRRSFREHPGPRGRRDLRVVHDHDFLQAFFPDPPATLIHTPCPPDLRYAWARQHRGPGAFALCGVTHTLSSRGALEWLGQLLTAPLEPYDALVCTSRAVLRMVRDATAAYADHLRERVGGDPRVRLRLEVIPLGVDTTKFHPPAPQERLARREALGVAHDEVAVLFVGRLAHHTKAHPFPLFDGAARAARATGRKVHLLMSGWAHNQAVFQAFRDGAAAFAPGVRVTFLDGTRPNTRFAVWHGADVFASLSDNIQETFGLVIAEAMASGLPVVASDWDGYRDLVSDGETGLLVPTLMVPGATADATARLVLETHSYDHYLAECSQAVAVDCGRAAEALTRLVGDEAQRRRMGDAGRRRALQHFAWPEVIRAYESLWREQQQQLREYKHPPPAGLGPALYPAPERAFAGYPTCWLTDDAVLAATAGAEARLEGLLATPLVTHAAWARVSDAVVLRAVLAAATGRPLADVEAVLTAAGADRAAARATLAWLLKYDLLRLTSAPAPGASSAIP